MKIEIISEDITHMSKTKVFTLEIDGKAIEISKHWFEEYNSCSAETEWNCPEDKDRKFIDGLSGSKQDKLDDFISELE